jgi:signal transduction histidine kinase
MGGLVWAALLAGGSAALIAVALGALLGRSWRRRLVAAEAGRTQAVESLRHVNRLGTAGTLSAGIAHECGTIVNVIGGRAQMIASGEATGEEAVASAEVVLAQCQRITELLQQLLGYTRRRRRLDQSLPVEQLVQQALLLLGPLARKRGVMLELRGGTTARVTAGPALQQVLTNLVVNGIQAMPDGGRLVIGLDEARRRPPGARAGTEAPFFCISVEDEGVGIPSSGRDRLFEPFFTTKQTGEGTGLGLWLARDIVRERGGFIEVDSEPGRGSRFAVYLPRGVA